MKVAGLGLWTPDYTNVASRRAGQARPQTEPALPPARVLRGTSLLTRMCIAAAQEAVTNSGFDARQVATVFGSAGGEIDIAGTQIEAMRRGEPLSPGRFKNSVHNTAAGIFSILNQNIGFTTAVAAGDCTFAAAMVEAEGLLASGWPQVVVCCGEEPVPSTLSAHCTECYAVAVAVAGGGTLHFAGDERVHPLRWLAQLDDSLLHAPNSRSISGPGTQ
jgi:3-oxoacyl-(acyl-carrier-protein) synthase